MDKIKEFIGSDKGRLVLICSGVFLVLLIFVAAAAPKTVNFILNSGKDNVYSMKKAKRTVKNRGEKK